MRKLLAIMSLCSCLHGCSNVERLSVTKCWPILKQGAEVYGEVRLVITPVSNYIINPACKKDFAGARYTGAAARKTEDLVKKMQNGSEGALSITASVKIFGRVSIVGAKEKLIEIERIEVLESWKRSNVVVK